MQAPALTRTADFAEPAVAAARPFRRAAVLGSGVMGSQIAAHLANAGLDVLLLDVTPGEIGREGRPNDVVEAGFKAVTKLRPEPFMSEAAKRRVRLGNFEEDFERIAEADWVIEVVVERMDIKRGVMERIERHVRADAVISTNTSGLPIGRIAEGRGEAFRRRFLGTHFFNPPRYLKLLELIPTADTEPEVVVRVAEFARVHLGKGIVVARDTPNFIGNRIGVYAMMRAMAEFTDGRFTIEEVDQLTGLLTGRPKSATFRTADVVGLDTLKHVADNLYDAIPDDESREAFRVPEVLDRLVEAGRLGQKTGAGFYRKEGKAILSVDPETLDYRPPPESDLDVSPFEGGSLPERLRRLYDDPGRAGEFFRRTTLDILAYSARRIPEIADSPADVDRAMRWGFGWEIGPFETWDTLGFERVRDDLAAAGIDLPAWVLDVPGEGFYTRRDGVEHVWVPETGEYAADPRHADEWGLSLIREEERVLWQNDEAALLDAGEGVALFEFRSKANTLGQQVVQGLIEAIEHVESDPDLRGMIVGNEGKNFSVGANLAELAPAIEAGDFGQVEEAVARFQRMVLAVRYSAKPVVVAVHQRVLGGACELTMGCPHPVAAAESYLGLVEMGVGLIPGGCGSTLLTARAAELAASAEYPSEIQPFLRKHFEQIATAKVTTSAFMAQEMNLLPPDAVIVMNAARRFHAARHEVVRLSEQGYRPPPVRRKIPVLGAPARARFEVMLHQYRAGGFASDYDVHLGRKLAWVMTGGDLSGPAEVHEDYLLELEREAILSLIGESKTQERIKAILTTGKPLRN